MDRPDAHSNSYSALTDQVSVEVSPFYLEDQSDPDEDYYVWAYRIEIINHGKKTIQLQSRYWNITDSVGKVEEVQGAGVVGEQPILNPGDSFQYTSGCPLNTPSGFMKGYYTMVDDDGRSFDVEIPPFSLDLPGSVTTMN